MGKHKKENAIKAGELQEGLQRFSFIADKKVIEFLKLKSEKENISIKELMNEALTLYLKKDPEWTIFCKRPVNKNELLLMEYLKNNA